MTATSLVLLLLLLFSHLHFLLHTQNNFTACHKCSSYKPTLSSGLSYCNDDLPTTVPVALPEETESAMTMSNIRVASAGINRS